jgi:hypothetical protein
MGASLAVEELEAMWERLAEAIDRAGPEREALFLSKLAVLLADALGDRARAERLIEAALENLA